MLGFTLRKGCAVTGPLPAAARENLATAIYRHIKHELMTGEHPPGTPMVLRSLAERMEVSQTPIREALLQLVSERVLYMSPGKSIRVPVFDRKRLGDLRAIRLKLEVMAAVAATPRLPEETIVRLEQIHRSLIGNKATENAAGTLRENFAFHSTLYAGCDMPDLIAIIETLWAQTGPSLIHLYRPPFFAVPGEHPHEEIIRGLHARDPLRVGRAVEHDIEGHGLALLERLPEQTAPSTASAMRAPLLQPPGP